MVSKFIALQMSAAFVFMLLCTQVARAQTTSDAMQVVSMTTTMLAKELKPGSPEAHIAKVVLTDSYAIVEWHEGHSGGEKLFQKKFGIGWVPLGGGAELRPSSLAAYDVPSTTATALVAGMKSCAKPQTLTFHGRVTAVCFVGPCKVC